MFKKIAIIILVNTTLFSQSINSDDSSQNLEQGKQNKGALSKDYDISTSISNIYFKYSNDFLNNKDIDSALKYCALAYQFDKGNSDIRYLFSRIYYEKGEYLKSYYILYHTFKNKNFSYYKTENVLAFYVKLLDRLKKFNDIKEIVLKNLSDFEIKNNSELIYYLLKSAKLTDDKDLINKYRVYVDYIANKPDIYSFLMSKEEYIEYLNSHINIFANAKLDKFYSKNYLNNIYLDSIITYLKLQSEYEKNQEFNDRKQQALETQMLVGKNNMYSDSIRLVSSSNISQLNDPQTQSPKTINFSILNSEVFNDYIKRGGNNPFIVYSMLKYEISQSQDKSLVDYKSYVSKFIEFNGFSDITVLVDFYSLLDEQAKEDLLKYFNSNDIFLYKDTDFDGYNDESYYYSNGKIASWYIDKNQDSIYDIVVNYDKDGFPKYFDQVNAKYTFGDESPIDIQYDKKRYYFNKFPFIDTVEFINSDNENTKIYLSGNNYSANFIKSEKKTEDKYDINSLILNNSLDMSSIPDMNFEISFVDNGKKNMPRGFNERDTTLYDNYTILKNQFNQYGFPYKQWVYSMGKKYAFRQDTNDNNIYDYIIIYDAFGKRNYGVKDIDEDGVYDIVEEFIDDKVVKTKFLDKDTNMDLYSSHNIVMADKRKFNDIFSIITNDIGE